VAVITNIYPDHLDYHGTMEKYVVTKAKIIRQAETVVVPRDFRFQTSDFGARIIRSESDGSIVSSNEAAAVGAVKVLGVPPAEAKKALEDFGGVEGRMEVVYRNKFLVVIDFAHTPESLAAALGSLRKLVGKNGRLMAVFGCAGERDHGRRRMGEVAAKMADFFVITAEDPRSEKVAEISEEIAGYAVNAGAVEGKDFIRIPDRQEAIDKAISLAKPKDVVGLFGKGHEKSMCYRREERPWSEHEAVKKALENQLTKNMREKDKIRGEGKEGIEG
jgi:UDP-N-acetylmuramoyl-L-alanyl-D-glutamate--2,6-diaminopimelate ligase